MDQDPIPDAPRVIPRQVKLGLDGSVERVIEETFDLAGRLDVMVNAAGLMAQFVLEHSGLDFGLNLG